MKKARLSIFTLVNLLVLVGYFMVVVFPMIWMAYTSLKSDQEIFLAPFALPDSGHLHWENYQRAWVGANFSQYFLNSVVVSAASLIGTLIIASMAAYALTCFRMRGGNMILMMLISGLMIPLQLALVPLFFQMRGMHLLNSRLGLILVYTAWSLPFAVFILSGFFKTLPSSLYEAAIMDGCSEWRAFWSVMLPLARPGLITVATFTFLGIWNEYFMAFMFMSGAESEAARTLPLGLGNISITSQYRSEWGTAFAGLVLVTVPCMIFCIALQKHMVKGISAGAVKG